MKMISRVVRRAFLVVSASMAVLPCTTSRAVENSLWGGGSGHWADASHWSSNPYYPHNGNGGLTYDATVTTGSVTLDQDITIQRFTLGGGALGGGSTLTLNDGLTWTAGTLGGAGTLALPFGSISTLAAPTGSASGSLGLRGRTIDNAGTINLSTRLGLAGGMNEPLVASTLNNLPAGVFNLQSAGSVSGSGTVALIFNNAGHLNVAGGAGSVDTLFNNSGTVTLQPSGGFTTTSLTLSGGGTSTGTFNLGTGSLSFGYSGPTSFYGGGHTLAEGTTITGSGTTSTQRTVQVTGGVTVQSNLSNIGVLEIASAGTLSVGGALTQSTFSSSSTTRLSGGTITLTGTQPFGVQGGTLAGSGTINGRLALGNSSTLSLQLGGATQSSGYDFINVSGPVTLGGNLAVKFRDGFESTISVSDSFTVLSSGSPFSGAFANVASGTRLDTPDGFGSFIVTYGGSSVVSLTNFSPNTRWLGGDGNWGDGSRWSSAPAFPNNSGSTNYSAVIQSGTVTLDQNITVTRFLLTGGALAGGNNLTLSEGMKWTAGTLAGAGTLTLPSGSISTFAAPAGSSSTSLGLRGRTINNGGTINLSTRLGLASGISEPVVASTLNNLPAGVFNLQSGGSVSGSGTVPLTFNNAGHLNVAAGGGSVDTPFNNSGTVTLQAGGGFTTTSLTLSGGGTSTGTFNIGNGSLSFGYGGPTSFYGNGHTLAGGTTIIGSGTTSTQGSVQVTGGVTVQSSLSNNAVLEIAPAGTLSVGGALTQSTFSSSSTTRLSGGTITLTGTQPFNVQGGTLAGSGTINGRLTLGNSSTLSLQLGGNTQGTSYDFINVSGPVTLAGNLAVKFRDGFESTISASDSFTVLSSGSPFSGAFANVASGTRLDTPDGFGSFIVTYAGSSAVSLTNFSPNTRWLGGDGNWSDASRWSSAPAFPNNSGSTNYSAVIQSGTVVLDQNITVTRFLLTGGALGGGNNLTLTEGMKWTAGTLGGAGTLTLPPGSISTFAAPAGSPSGSLGVRGRTIENAGTINLSTRLTVTGGVNEPPVASALNNLPAGVINLQSGGTVSGSGTVPLTFNNAGNLNVASGGGSVDTPFNNSGTVTLQPSGGFATTSLTLSGGGTSTGTFNIGNGSLSFGYGGPTGFYGTGHTLAGGTTVTGSGTTSTQGNVQVTGGVSVQGGLSNIGVLEIASAGTLSVGGALTQSTFSSSSTTRLSGGTITLTGTQPFNVQGGTLAGSGTINGRLALGNSSTLSLQLGGNTQGRDYDFINVSGPVTLAGNLAIALRNGFEPQVGDAFTILAAGSVSGSFATTSLPTFAGTKVMRVSYGSHGVVLSVHTRGSYDDWKATRFTLEEQADPSISGPAADPDRDGQNNRLEHFFGTQPKLAQSRVAMNAAIVTEQNGERLAVLTFPRAQGLSDTAFAIERSTDLSNTNGWADAAYEITNTAAGNGVDVLTVKVLPAISSDQKQFFRIRLE